MKNQYVFITFMILTDCGDRKSAFTGGTQSLFNNILSC